MVLRALQMTTTSSVCLSQETKESENKVTNRDIQRRNTKESRILDLVNETNSLIREIESRVDRSVLTRRARKALLKQNEELIRLRRALIREQNHKERLVAGLIPRLRSKANECRQLRQKLYGHENRVRKPSRLSLTK